ncbi:MAG: DUF4864 domain-containing protein [Acidobacteria bacterium]|nr:DUF4864 domain-containing protein [Acidobacteriota bacterium]
MNDSSPFSPPAPAPEWDSPPVPDPREEATRLAHESSLRRLTRLLVAGCALFTLTIWLFVRLENPSRLFPFVQGPAHVVRQHLEALNRGEFREAYLLFSQHYRDEVSFELYHELIVTHSAMFRTRIISVSNQETSADRVVLGTRLLSSNGERYLARFTLVRTGDRWWIDDLRWGADSGRRNVIAV